MDYKELRENTFFILGPCVIESEELAREVAAFVKNLSLNYEAKFVFKSSFDKANRTSIESFRGPGLSKGLDILGKIREDFALPILTDIHESNQAQAIGEIVDIIQIPAFLCRQTDLLVSSAKTGKIINIKKAQFLNGVDMKYPLQKVIDSGNNQAMLTERGSMYGYGNLVVDYRNMLDMMDFGVPIIFDGTHSVQKPGASGGKSGGDRKYVPSLVKAAFAVGVRGFFLEIHPNPENALSDGPNMLDFIQIEKLIQDLVTRK